MASALESIIQRLVDKGLGVGGETIFAGGDMYPPEGGNFITIEKTGGPSATRTHNAGDLRHPSFQITARGDEYLPVAQLAEAAWEAFGGGVNANKIVNMVIGGIFFLYIRPASEPFDMPNDANNRVRSTFNIETMRQ